MHFFSKGPRTTRRLIKAVLSAVSLCIAWQIVRLWLGEVGLPLLGETWKPLAVGDGELELTFYLRLLVWYLTGTAGWLAMAWIPLACIQPVTLVCELGLVPGARVYFQQLKQAVQAQTH